MHFASVGASNRYDYNHSCCRQGSMLLSVVEHFHVFLHVLAGPGCDPVVTRLAWTYQVKQTLVGWNPIYGPEWGVTSAASPPPTYWWPGRPVNWCSVLLHSGTATIAKPLYDMMDYEIEFCSGMTRQLLHLRNSRNRWHRHQSFTCRTWRNHSCWWRMHQMSERVLCWHNGFGTSSWRQWCSIIIL